MNPDKTEWLWVFELSRTGEFPSLVLNMVMLPFSGLVFLDLALLFGFGYLWMHLPACNIFTLQHSACSSMQTEGSVFREIYIQVKHARGMEVSSSLGISTAFQHPPTFTGQME